MLSHSASAGLPAVRQGRVYAVDGAYFNRPGPRVIVFSMAPKKA
jgi:ABC-type Fe3+-hydroxamate transport system substrate-binding protein